MAIPSSLYYFTNSDYGGSGVGGAPLPSGTECIYTITAYGAGDFPMTYDESGREVVDYEEIASGLWYPEFNGHRIDMTGDVISVPLRVDSEAPQLENSAVSVEVQDGKTTISGKFTDDGAIASVEVVPLVKRTAKSDPTRVDYAMDRNNSFYAEYIYDAGVGEWTPSVIEEHSGYRMEHAIELDGQRLSSNPAARTRMKEAIAQYGAVTFSYNWIHEVPYDNPSRGGFGNPHACTIIGWDDTIPASLFSGGASQDGGWLVKNSYSSLPYFYLSYDNNSSYVFAFDYATKEEYDFNYFYDSSVDDFGMAASLNYTCAANVFQGLKGSDSQTEYVKAVQVGFYGSGATCDVKVYTNLQDQQDMSDLANVDPTLGTLAASGTATFDRPGYHTVPLEQLAEVAPGSYFSIVVQISGSSPYLRVIRAADCKSYVLSQYGAWQKSGLNVPRLKAYTVLENTSTGLTPEETPHASIDDTPEALTGLMPEATYLVNSAALTADGNGSLALQSEWFGSTVSIVKQGDGTATGNSVAQTLKIPNHPAAPAGVE